MGAGANKCRHKHVEHVVSLTSFATVAPKRSGSLPHVRVVPNVAIAGKDRETKPGSNENNDPKKECILDVMAACMVQSVITDVARLMIECHFGVGLCLVGQGFDSSRVLGPGPCSKVPRGADLGQYYYQIMYVYCHMAQNGMAIARVPYSTFWSRFQWRMGLTPASGSTVAVGRPSSSSYRGCGQQHDCG